MIKVFSILSIITAMLFTGCKSNANESALHWNDNLETAVQIAQKENKIILVNFTGSDWCKWCKKLNAEVFTQDEFIDYAKKNLVLVKLDFPENIPQTPETIAYNKQMLYRFGVEGYPTIVLLDSRGYIIAKTGYQKGGAEAYVKHLKSFL